MELLVVGKARQQIDDVYKPLKVILLKCKQITVNSEGDLKYNLENVKNALMSEL